jgi:XTP/dITP diphosphohydrolase
MILLSPDGRIHSIEAYCRGRISHFPAGSNGFGYDPIFLPEEYHFRKTMSELSNSAKNSISHRRKALDGIKKILKKEAYL